MTVSGVILEMAVSGVIENKYHSRCAGIWYLTLL